MCALASFVCGRERMCFRPLFNERRVGHKKAQRTKDGRNYRSRQLSCALLCLLVACSPFESCAMPFQVLSGPIIPFRRRYAQIALFLASDPSAYASKSARRSRTSTSCLAGLVIACRTLNTAQDTRGSVRCMFLPDHVGPTPP